MKNFFFSLAFIFCLAALFSAPIASGSGKKNKRARVSFHIETEGTDNPKMIFPYKVMGKQKYFRRIPEISAKDLVAFSPFPAENQISYGVVFKLRPAAQRRLAAVSSVSTGKWLIAQAFGRVVDGVMIDEPVEDGAIVIWEGLSLQEINELDLVLRRVGEKKPRGKKKKK